MAVGLGSPQIRDCDVTYRQLGGSIRPALQAESVLQPSQKHIAMEPVVVQPAHRDGSKGGLSSATGSPSQWASLSATRSP